MKRQLEKLKTLRINILTQWMRCLPIKKNKVFIMSYYGKSYDCSPKYLTEYAIGHKERCNWDIVWAFDTPQKYEKLSGIRKVKVMSIRYFYELYTARVVVTNYRMTKQFNKHLGQYYIQTWHSSLRLKQIEKDAEATLTPQYIGMAKSDSKQCDLLVSGCKMSTQIFKRAFWYEGHILECGTPRNDYLIKGQQVQQEEMKQRLGIAPDAKVLLYAPTFRKGHDLSVYDLVYRQLQEQLEKKWGGEWVILIRLHPHLCSEDLHITWSEWLRDGSKWDDIQELLSIADVLISDYSSLMFDFSLTRKPCFLYVPDLASYVEHDRGLYFDIQKLPFEIAEDQQMLGAKIEQFDQQAYQARLQQFNEQIGSFEQGNACELLAAHITKIMKK